MGKQRFVSVTPSERGERTALHPSSLEDPLVSLSFPPLLHLPLDRCCFKRAMKRCHGCRCFLSWSARLPARPLDGICFARMMAAMHHALPPFKVPLFLLAMAASSAACLLPIASALQGLVWSRIARAGRQVPSPAGCRRGEAGSDFAMMKDKLMAILWGRAAQSGTADRGRARGDGCRCGVQGGGRPVTTWASA